jgi:hypothetical protein
MIGDQIRRQVCHKTAQAAGSKFGGHKAIRPLMWHRYDHTAAFAGKFRQSTCEVEAKPAKEAWC